MITDTPNNLDAEGIHESVSIGELSMHNDVRARAQSIITTGGRAAPLPSYEEALDIIAWHESHQARLRAA